MPHSFHRFLPAAVRLALVLFSLASITVAQATNLRFGWNASADPNVAGYNLSYGTTAGRYTKTVNAGNTTATNVSLKPGATYYFVVTAYDSFGFQSAPSNEVALTIVNKPPSVSLTSPQMNSSFSASSSIGLSATASDPDGAIAKVEFYRDTSKIGESTSAPYATTWNNIPAGSYTLTALAFDDSGAAVRSSGIPVTISGSTSGPTATPSTMRVRAIALTPFVRAGGVARFKIVASQVNASQNTVVNYSLGGSATGNVNYSMSGMTGQVTIPTGQRSVLMPMQTIAVPGGGNKNVSVSIVPGTGYVPGRGTAVVRIVGH